MWRRWYATDGLRPDQLFDRGPNVSNLELLTERVNQLGVITRAGGVASLAHPGLLERDELIPKMVEHGLQAIEAYHTDHPPELAARYLEMAERLGLLVTGGSDFHTPEGPGPTRLGCRELTTEALEKIREASQS